MLWACRSLEKALVSKEKKKCNFLKFHFVVLVTEGKLFCVSNSLHMGKSESISELALSVVGGSG